MAKRKFSSGYFDEEFFAGKTKGAVRNLDSPFYRFFASRVHACLKLVTDEPKNFSIIDIGGGVGWEAKHYLAFEYDAIVADVSEWAYQNSVMPEERKICCDIRELGKTLRRNKMPSKFDLVIANRVLAYLPNNQAANKAIKELAKVSKKYVLLAIICSDHKGVKVQEWAKNSGRLNFQPKKVYEKMFKANGLKLNEEFTNIMLYGRQEPHEGGWDCVWFLEKE